MKSRWKKYLFYSSVVIVVGGLILFLIPLGYSYSWTGFGEYTPNNPDAVRSKTLWDWMELLIIPFVLAGGAFYLNSSERAIERKTAEYRAKLERELATDRQQEAALQAYIKQMSELLLDRNLKSLDVKPEVRDVARTLTISVMRGLDTKRNNLILQFLREAKLITDENSILIDANMSGMNLQLLNMKELYLQGGNLHRADLQGANLQGANLQDAFLFSTNLQDADLEGADLQGAILRGVNLQGANLEGAYLQGANLEGAYLQGANLHLADLQDVNLQGANMQGANMQGANLQGAMLTITDLQGAYLQSANLQSARLHGANLQDAFLNGAKLKNAKLQGAKLKNAKLQGANLQGANLEGAYLQGAYLQNADLAGANFEFANLQGAKDITREQLESVISLEWATMPDGTKHE